jgi:hypothetical protein
MVFFVAVAPLCASWCSGRGCTVNVVVSGATARHAGCHRAMQGGKDAGWSATAADALCPAGEFVIRSLRADVAVAADASELVAAHSVAAAESAANFVMASDSVKIRRSLDFSSFSSHVVPDSIIPLRI